MRYKVFSKKRIISLLLIVAIIVSCVFTTVSIAAETSIANNNEMTVNFSDYAITATTNAMKPGNARSNAGDFTIVSDSSCSGGKALKFARNKGKNATSSSQYAFLLNPTGSYAQVGSTMLKPSTTYKLKIRYKITGINDNQVYQLRLYNTKDGKYDIGNVDTSSPKSIVFSSTGPQKDFIEATYEFVSPTCGTNGYNLAASIAPYTSTTVTGDTVATVNTDWSYEIDYINIVAADIYDNFDFSSYNGDLTVDGSTVKTSCGAFEVVADEKAQGGKYLRYLRNSEKQITGYEDPANYGFLLNRWGESGSQFSYNLKSNTEYSITVKYRIVNTDSEAANQIWQFRLYNTVAGKYDVANIDSSSAVKILQTKGNTDGFVTKVFNFTSPVCESENVNLIGCFVPTTDSTVTSSNNVAALADYEIDIDYILFGEPAEIPPDEDEPDGIHTIDFNKYFVKTDSSNIKASVRTEAGKYSIEKDPECSNGSYLKFKRNDAKASQDKCDGRAVYMFQMNKTGSYTAENATVLTPDTMYEMTIRYRMIDMPDDINYQFGIYNAANYTLANWSGSDGGVSNRGIIFNSNGSTDGWVTETYYFSAPQAGGTKYGLIGGFYPTSTATANNNAAKLVYEYEYDIDYIDIKQCENQGQLPSFIRYPLDEKYLKTLDDSEISNIVFMGKGNNFWSDQFDIAGAERAISFSWTNVEKKSPLYQKFQKINTIKMLDDTDTTGFYQVPAKADFMTAFVAGIIDITDYINTGYLRFWVKVERDVEVKISMLDESYANAFYETTFKKTSENDGFYEVSIPLRAFYDSAVSSEVKWNHSRIRCIKILPKNATADGFMRNGEEMIFSQWQIWSKAPQDTHMDINRYFYAQLGCDMKIRDENDVMAQSTTLKAYHNTLEEDAAKKTVANKYNDAAFKELWSIYAMDTTKTDSRFQQPYEAVDLMIPKTGIFATTGLSAALIKGDGTVKTIPAHDEGEYLVLKVEEFGEIAFFVSAKASANAALASSISGAGLSTLGSSGGGTAKSSAISTFVNTVALNAGNIKNAVFIWAIAAMLIAGVCILFSYDNVTTRRFICNAMSVMLCICMVAITMCGCGKSETESKKKKKKKVIRRIIVTQNVDEEEEDDTYYFDDDEDDVEEATTANSEESLLEIRIVNDHPGIPGYDAEYEFRALYGPDMDMSIISADEYTLSCSVPEVKINGNKIILPASFRETTKLDGFKIYATYNADKTKTAFFPMNVVKWSMSFNDEFDGTELDMTKWSDETDIYVDLKKSDMGNGTTNIRLTDYCYLENGNFVMPIVKNTENKSWNINLGGLNKYKFTPTYVSSEIRTENTFGQKYGCFSVRMKAPGSNYVHSGTNSCFWMMPKNGAWGKDFMFKYVSGDNAGYSCGEIDVVERSAYWGKGEWQNTLHVWDSMTGAKKDSSGNLLKVYNDELLTGDYIEYTTAWTRNALHTYANGKLIRSETGIEEAGSEAFLIISNNLNSMNPDKPAWTGYATEEDLDKLTVYVDYVRVYKVD